MTTPWLPPTFAHPLRVEVAPGVHLRPIRAEDVDIDMVAVMGNQLLLWDKYGDAWGWPPADMTAEQDREDLARHAHEMTTHESFNYAILPSDESSLWGCIYIDPAEEDDAPADAPADAPHAPGTATHPGPAADVSWWVVPQAPAGVAEAINEFVPAWLARDWPFASVSYPFGELD